MNERSRAGMTICRYRQEVREGVGYEELLFEHIPANSSSTHFSELYLPMSL